MMAGIMAATLLLWGVPGPHSRNVCFADAWLPLRQGEHAQHWTGPDQSGYVVERADGRTWRIGLGGFGAPLGRGGKGLGRPVLRIPGHVVHEVKGVGGPRPIGYLLLETRRLRDGGSEAFVDFDSIYIGGPALTGGSADLSFLRRFIFGARAKAMCARADDR